MATQRERILYSGHDTTITESHAIVGGRTYAFGNIHSASLDKTAGWTPYGWAALLLGIAIAVGGYLAWETLLPPLIGGTALAIGGAALLIASPRSYAVKIRDHDGSVISIPVTNEGSAHEIIEAIDKARLAQ
jgi:hypothetical protein